MSNYVDVRSSIITELKNRLSNIFNIEEIVIRNDLVCGTITFSFRGITRGAIIEIEMNQSFLDNEEPQIFINYLVRDFIDLIMNSSSIETQLGFSYKNNQIQYQRPDLAEIGRNNIISRNINLPIDETVNRFNEAGNNNGLKKFMEDLDKNLMKQVNNLINNEEEIKINQSKKRYLKYFSK